MMLQTLLSKITVTYIVLLYIGLRILSFFTYTFPVLNQIIAVIAVIAFGYLGIKKISFAWIVLVAELLLDGAGHFFELQGFILRTWFLGIFALLWLVQAIKRKDIFTKIPKLFFVGMALVSVVILWSIINGFLKGHYALSILQDAILYAFFFLLFPALEYRLEIKKHFPLLIKAFILGSAIFSLLSFFLYSSGIGSLPDLYYHWFRNIAAGKITDLGDNFFRIVLPEHIFIVPLILILTSHLIQDWKNKTLWFFLFLSSLILSLNFSRIYFVALAAGMICLVFKNSLKKWFIVSATVTLCILLTFSSLYFVASRGKSLGLELVGLRIGGATSPIAETSGAIRLAILPDAIRTIKTHPWMGSGLGTTITYIDPASQKEVTRTQFDWGYLEVIAELGILGAAIFLFFLLAIVYALARQTYFSSHPDYSNRPLFHGLIAGAISLFVINITTPSLFHGFGMLYFVFLLLMYEKTKSTST